MSDWLPPKQREDLRWFGLDFDGTVCDSLPPDYIPRSVLPGVEKKMLELAENGWKIIIFTSRPSADHELVQSFLRHHKLPFDSIQTGKILCHRYCDDRNILPSDESWLP